MSEDPDGQVRLERSAAVATLTLDRPAKLNAMTVEMDKQINGHAYTLNGDDQVRAVVLTGAGTRAFCAGSDLTGLSGYGTNWQYRNRFDRRLDYVRAVWSIRVPVVAAISGYCMGGGLEMACACDVRFCTPESTFAAAEIRWGWHGGSGQTQLLTKLVGAGAASELLLGGQSIDADRALAIGLVQRVVQAEELPQAAAAFASLVAGHAPVAVQSVKNLVRVAQTSSYEVGFAYENDMLAYEMRTADAAEGQRAFADRRAPRFTGE